MAAATAVEMATAGEAETVWLLIVATSMAVHSLTVTHSPSACPPPSPRATHPPSCLQPSPWLTTTCPRIGAHLPR
eukprot:6235437-Prymnesium_polylepis.1